MFYFENNVRLEAGFMTVNVSSIGLKGLEDYRVQVQVRISPGKDIKVNKFRPARKASRTVHRNSQSGGTCTPGPI
jgi:hypothetical protein